MTYKRVLFKKRVPGRPSYREIHIPEHSLLQVQQWIVNNILRYTTPHSASFAYHPNSQPVFAAQEHCKCKWLIKIDIHDFFHSISERMVYSVFKDLGYSKLLSFELARMTTMVPLDVATIKSTRSSKWEAIPLYKNDQVGFLPQGAPTSPMLSNLAMNKIDVELSSLAKKYGFKYTRYSDDLAFSTKENIGTESARHFKQLAMKELLKKGFKPNHQKTAIRGLGSRRVILGILVDGATPRLTREYKDSIKQHLYYLTSEKHGVSIHAAARKMSISTLYYHIRGKIAWAERVEPGFGAVCLKEFDSISWPPIDSIRTVD